MDNPDEEFKESSSSVRVKESPMAAQDALKSHVQRAVGGGGGGEITKAKRIREGQDESSWMILLRGKGLQKG